MVEMSFAYGNVRSGNASRENDVVSINPEYTYYVSKQIKLQFNVTLSRMPSNFNV